MAIKPVAIVGPCLICEDTGTFEIKRAKGDQSPWIIPCSRCFKLRPIKERELVEEVS